MRRKPHRNTTSTCYNVTMEETRNPCPLCSRMIRDRDLSRHHVIPRSRGGANVEPVCRTCHRQIHALFGNRQLARELNSLDRLRENPQMAVYLRWVATRNPDRYFPGKTSRLKRR